MALGNVGELRDVAHAQVDVLFDVVALLRAAREVAEPGEEATEQMRRLIRIAEDRTEDAIEALSPWI